MNKIKSENTLPKPPDISIDAAVVLKIAEHYCHARAKHPHFADRMFFDEYDAEWAKRDLARIRRLLDIQRKQDKVHAETLANCEVAEASEAFASGDKAAAVEECYDAIAVLLRMVDVLEGRQELGKPNKGAKE